MCTYIHMFYECIINIFRGLGSMVKMALGRVSQSSYMKQKPKACVLHEKKKY